MANLMKCILFITSLFLISGCSNAEQLELVDHSVSIEVRDGEMVVGEKVFSGVYLRYEVSIRNNGSNTVGGIDEPNAKTYQYDDGLLYRIEPSNELVKRSMEILGKNIFDEDFTASTTPILISNEITEDNYVEYYLGTLENTAHQPVAPSKEQLELLKDIANDATLMVFVKDEEMARFNLNEE